MEPQPLPPAKTSGMAIAGFVLAFFCGLLGIIFSAIALGQINSSEGRLKGKGLAIAGLVISIAFFVVAVLAVVAIPAFMEYTHKAKSNEAVLQLNRLKKYAFVYAAEHGSYPIANGPTAPAANCCDQPGHVCAAGDPAWNDQAWQELDFRIDEPSLYQYSFTSTGTEFTATAVADLNCDSEGVTTYTLSAFISEGTPMAPALVKTGKD